MKAFLMGFVDGFVTALEGMYCGILDALFGWLDG